MNLVEVIRSKHSHPAALFDACSRTGLAPTSNKKVRQTASPRAKVPHPMSLRRTTWRAPV